MKKHDYNPYFDGEKEADEFHCPICGRLTSEENIENHHLIPKSKKGKETERVCVSCGDMVHKIFSLKEMEREYNSIEKILTHPDIQNWIKWISKKPDDFSVCMKSKKGRKRKTK